MPTTPQEIHGMDGQEDGEIELGLVFRNGNAKVEFTASLNHVLQHLVDRVLVLAGPTRHFASHFPTKTIQKGCRTQFAGMARQTGK
jgi:hypothetical protein